MGFTHYFKRPATLPKKEWKQFVEEIEMLKSNLPEHGITAGCFFKDEHIEIAGWNGKEYDDPEAPIYDRSEESIAFNGIGDFGHESFVLERVVKPEKNSRYKKGELIFSFCKTARKPYDTFVCLVLISFKRWFMGKVRVSSDGNEEDWAPALELYHELTKAHIPTYSILMYDPDEKD